MGTTMLAAWLWTANLAAGGEDAGSLPPHYSGSWGLCSGPEPHVIGLLPTLVILLALAMAVHFLVGLFRRHNPRVPLVLGLFALGFGALGTVTGLIEMHSILARYGGANPVDLHGGTAHSLQPVELGLIAALAGGLFALILSWRAKRLAAREAEDHSTKLLDADETQVQI